METSSEYVERKRRELDLLCRHAGEPGPASALLGDALLVEKRRLRARMIARFVEREPALTETRFDRRPAPLATGGPAISYFYQRYDLRAHRKPFAEWLYPLARAPSPRVSFGVLTGSGMAAIASTLVALDQQLRAPRALHLGVDAYFETAQFAGRYLQHLRPVEIRAPSSSGAAPLDLAPGDVLYLDSIAREPHLRLATDEALAALAAVVMDTTCYDGAAEEIDRAVARCLPLGVPLVLLRSHIKLDSLAVEYGRVGSIAFLLPRPCPPRLVAFARALKLRALDFLAKTGGGLQPSALYPFFDDPEFRALNRARNERIRDNNLAAAAALEERVHEAGTTRIRAYHHGAFLFVQPIVELERFVELATTNLVDRLARAGVDARRAPTFGYDFTSLTRLAGAQFQSAAGLRVSLSDLPEEELARAIDAIADWAIDLDR